MAKKEGAGKPGLRNPDLVASLDSSARWRRGLFTVLFLALILCLLMPELVFQNRIFLVPDTKAPISFREVGAKTLEEGTYPLWNPYIFCGMPSYQSLSYTPYVYPVSFLIYLLQRFIGFPEMSWLLLHYLMAGLGVFLLLRSFEVRTSVAALAGAVFMIMPNFVANGANGHGSQACAVAYMPFALLLLRRILLGRNRVAGGALLGIVLGFQMLRGHIQISYYTFLMIGLFLLLETIRLLRAGKWRDAAAGVAFVAAGFILALGIASVLILPVKEYARYSIRGGDGGGLDYGYATGWSLHPREILTFVFPWAAGFGKGTYWGHMPFTDYPNYVGVVTAIFSLVAMAITRNRWKWYFFAGAALSTLVAFGSFFPVLYKPMFRFLPYFDKFRVPVMILIVQQLMLVVLMGMGIEDYLRLSSAGSLPRFLGSGRFKWAMAGAAAFLAIVLAGNGAIKEGLLGDEAIRSRIRPEYAMLAVSSYAGDLARTAFILAASAAILLLASLKKFGAGAVVMLLGLVALVDLFTVDHPILHPEKGWNAEGYRIIRPREAVEEFKKENRAAGFLSGDKSIYRIFPVPAAQPGSWSHNVFPFSDNSYMISGIQSMGGYHAAKLKNYQDLMDVMFATFNRGSMPTNILNMMGAKYFVSFHKIFREGSPYPLVHEEEGNYIYLNPGALPRVFFVDKIRVAPAGEILSLLTQPTFDPSREVIFDHLPPGVVESAEGSEAEITDYSLNSIAIRARVEKPCVMVLGEIDYPGWKATVDGADTPVITANHCLRALVVGPGDHDIVFKFESGVISGSLRLSIISFAVSLLAVAVPAAVRKRRGGNPWKLSS